VICWIGLGFVDGEDGLLLRLGKLVSPLERISKLVANRCPGAQESKIINPACVCALGWGNKERYAGYIREFCCPNPRSVRWNRWKEFESVLEGIFSNFSSLRNIKLLGSRFVIYVLEIQSRVISKLVFLVSEGNPSSERWRLLTKAIFDGVWSPGPDFSNRDLRRTEPVNGMRMILNHAQVRKQLSQEKQSK